MEFGFELTLEQSQKLVMTPELIQAIKILQLSTAELDAYIEEELLTNPTLEVAEHTEPSAEKSESSPDDSSEELREDLLQHIREKDYDDISYSQLYYNHIQDYTYEHFVAQEFTLADRLRSQLHLMPLSKKELKLAKYIVESLDGNGYLCQGTEELSFVLKVGKDDIEKAVALVQSLDPAGVGARSLEECLLLQVKRKGWDYEKFEKVIKYHLNDLAANRMSSIARSLDVSAREAQSICDDIRDLEPKPGRVYGSSQDNRYLPADVIAEKTDGSYVVTLNDRNIPELAVSSYYQKVLSQNSEDPETIDFLNNKINSAVWLIKSIEQRKKTILSVAETIVKYQSDFLDKGPNYLRPLTLMQIADELGIHESTVSRTVNGKYIQTPKGLYELRSFFTGGTTGDDGEDVAAASIKLFIKEMIETEDHAHPYSDQTISEALKEKRGLSVARRTVAKYREAMNIPSSSGRRRY